MNRWIDKVAIVTGASSGIGVAISKALVLHGVKVVGLARRLDKLQEIARELGKDKFYPIQCDISKEEDILRAFESVEKQLGGVDILINNAAVLSSALVIESDTEEYHKIIDTNLIAPAICSRETAKSLRKRNAYGHIININSITGQFAESVHVPISMFGASKCGLRALGIELRHEVIALNLNIKVTNITPGVVDTEMTRSLLKGNKISDLKALKDKDIADTVIYVLRTPETVEIPEITIIPHKEIIGLPKFDV
ncbi:unnamed protein product [Xylocopa violacea]|uniref:Farnesol dehydrogenase n=1 Tax=Xylocopa violacea TaxID=135666 RepID=A0ABP1NXN7_XYLVO